MAEGTGQLAALQHWLQSALLHPEDTGPPDDNRTPGDALPLTTPAALSPRQSLALYQDSYRLRLTSCLRTLFPAMVDLLGEELFDGFAEDYLRAHPSHRHTLSTLGEHFADHLERHRPDADLPAAQREDWIDLLVDLARLEQLYTEVLDAEGTEAEPGSERYGERTGECAAGGPLPEQVPGAAWLDAPRLRPAPCLRLLRTRAVVHSYLHAAHHRGPGREAVPDLPEYRPTRLAVSRRDFTVVVREIGPDAYAVLGAVCQGATPGEALRAAGVDPHRGWPWLREWTTAGFLTTADRHTGTGFPAVDTAPAAPARPALNAAPTPVS
ncbi:putative DNA-binding domain-containing protein [Streptomyces sp. NPDC058000]|uniref:HvfC/BufC family peptide modification chaperone n=1 Tax=Streptomyces sp. NPDC058000 TaxID=3346299 RepID=UPI0036EEEA33